MKFTTKKFDQLTLQELYTLLSIRQEVFVVEQNCPYLDADFKDQSSWHIMGFSADQMVACTRLVPPGVSYDDYASIGRVLTTDKVRGTGVGKLLMEESMYQCQRLFPDIPIKISAQCYLLQFYEAFGFQKTGEPYLEDDIPHQAMIYLK